MSHERKLSAHHARAVAVAAGCDPRTVLRRLGGAHVQPLTRERIDRALAAQGFGGLLAGLPDAPANLDSPAAPARSTTEAA